jgi:hypothetical protein
MHECPTCQMVCDCDGEDIWWGFDSEAVEDCTHDCEEDEDDDWDIDLYG